MCRNSAVIACVVAWLPVLTAPVRVSGISNARWLAFDGTVQGYIEDADQFKENAMQSLLRQKTSLRNNGCEWN
jgi:hypothetical protein